MLRSVKDLWGYRLDAKDDILGSVYDLYFDDQTLQVRYFVARTVAYIGRRVLIAPAAVGEPRWAGLALDVKLTREQIKGSPGVDLRKPVSKQVAQEVNEFYGWPVFEQREHLRSVREVLGYHISARDGDIGHLEDLILDSEQWTFPSLVVDTRNVLPGRMVMLPATAIERLSWAEQSVFVRYTKQQVRDSPLYDATAPVNEMTIHTDYRGVPREPGLGTVLL